MSTTDEFDAAIVGGGLVGLSLAALLGRAGVSVAVIEPNEPVREWPEESIDLRVYAITRASERLFREVDAWAGMQGRAGPFLDMRVWDAGGSGDIHFDSAEVGEPCLGHILESRVIEASLLRVIEDLASVRLLCPAAVKGFADLGERQEIELEDGARLTARLLVGADGRRSKVRGYAGIHARVSEYGQQALVAVVTTERPHEETAWQRFLPNGPLAFLPLFDGRSSIVWSTRSDEAKQLLRLDDAAFREALGKAFGFRLGKVLECGERALFPLVRQSAEHYVKPRLALIGDAAHVIHPLAGQGVNLGLKDARELAHTLLSARAEDRDIGAFPVLRRYERARKGDNLLMMSVMDAFKHLFGSPALPVRWARNAGLDLVDAAPVIKNRIMRSAMGL
ncbi:MAG: UbiH/UbiF/VisC/COQ6 family ubiquinone biosynthesis hydroxylase [Gammaproteobacteria bacterium]|jgi:2-octaprenylphenol hydroxylase